MTPIPTPPFRCAGDQVIASPDDRATDAVVRAVALEVEAHVAASGWDQPARLYALVPTSELMAAEPALAARLGLDAQTGAGSFTPVEQEDLPADRPLEQLLHEIVWPPQVAGCAAVMERVLLPDAVEQQLPDDEHELAEVVSDHPLREDVRVAAAVTRDGRGHCAVRLRANDHDDAVMDGADLVPGLLTLLDRTLED